MRLSRLALGLVCVVLPLAARADTFTFVNTSFADGATATGSVNIDTVNGLFGTLNLVVKDGASTYTFNSPSPGIGHGLGTNDVFTNYRDALGDLINFELSTTTLVGYKGGAICTLALCGQVGYLNVGAGDDVFTGGLLVATTPEPSAFVLLSTGLGGLVAVRRRLRG